MKDFKDDNTVLEVVKNGMCIGCGLCELACRFGAIRMMYNTFTGTYNPRIDQSRCSSCGQCLEVCFGANVDYTIEKEFSDNLKSTLGNCTECYSGYAMNQQMRYEGSSGGVVSALLACLLDRGIVDGVIVTEIRSGNPPLARARVARSISQVQRSMGSKYCPVYIAGALKDMKKGEVYAFVGLPCQVYGVKKLEEIGRIPKTIIFYIGLFCGGVPNYNAVKYLLWKWGFADQRVTRMEYRGGGWPGRLIIGLEEGVVEEEYVRYWPMIFPWFYMPRCAICLSGFNINADVSCGDLWLPQVVQEDQVGTSVIVSRSNRGEEMLNLARTHGFIKTDCIPTRLMIFSQRSMIDLKHRHISARLRVLHFLNRNHLVKEIGGKIRSNHSRKQMLNVLLQQIGNWLVLRRRLWSLFHVYQKGLKLIESTLRFLRTSVE